MELLLGQDELLDLGENLQGLIVICQSGSCWLTQSGDTRDYILRSNTQVEVHSKGQLVICATSPCRLQLTTPKAPAQLPLVPVVANLQ